MIMINVQEEIQNESDAHAFFLIQCQHPSGRDVGCVIATKGQQWLKRKSLREETHFFLFANANEK